jgi:hypothetical protein
MSKGIGQYVYYINKDGQQQKAQMIYADQLPAFTDHGKAMLKLLRDDLTSKLDPISGKQLISLRKASELINIGFID